MTFYAKRYILSVYERGAIKMTKRLISMMLCILMILPMCGTLTVDAAYAGGSYISASGACVMDYNTGEILYEHNGNIPRVPASMTKIMNMYCVYEAIENGEITLDTIVPISENVYKKSRNSVYQSVLPLYYDQNYTVDELIGVVVTYSASGAAIALAELVGGSEVAFVERMNKKVAEMGIDAYYYDSCGIANNEISPIGMATLARNIIRDYPDILVRSGKKSVTFRGNVYNTTNHLLDTYYYGSADGLKTGTTAAAGYCFCGTAKQNGVRLISVVMNSSSTGQRFIDTAALLDYGFSIAIPKYNYVYFTDAQTFIDGNEVPTFFYNGAMQPVIVAEDLQNYGFDVDYKFDSETVSALLTLTYNKDKTASPIPMDYYKGKNGERAYYLMDWKNISVVVNDGTQSYQLSDVYQANGYTLISAEELGGIFDFSQDSDGMVTHITTEKETVDYPVVGGERLTSKSAYIMDYDTGEELYSFDGDTQRPVASIAKMMSVYVILDAIKNGEITPDTIVPISENVYKLSRVEDYKMMVNLEYDESYTVDEMIDMIVIDSAAACVTAVAELLCGSEAEFVKRMNAKAEEIGIDSVFYNGTGVCLNPETDNENLMSAREVAVMTQKMIQDYPEILERTKQASVDFHGATYYNLNKLFTDYYYEGADGFKNGMTEAAGYCMCGTATRDGKRIITVTLPSDANETRFTDTIKMFDYGFKQLGVDTSEAAAKPNEHTFSDGDSVKINIDGNYEMTFPDQQPVVINGRAVVPIRAIMETLGKTVEWNAEERQTVISDETTTVKLKIDDSIMIKETKNLLDGSVKLEEVELDVSPVLINDRTCLPLRAVVEAFGAAVIWEEETETILIIAGVC